MSRCQIAMTIAKLTPLANQTPHVNQTAHANHLYMKPFKMNAAFTILRPAKCGTQMLWVFVPILFTSPKWKPKYGIMKSTTEMLAGMKILRYLTKQ